MQNERTEKRREFIINTVYFVFVVLIAYFSVKYVLKWIMPFVIGFLIALMARPAVNVLSGFFKMNKKFAGIFVVLIEYTVLAVVLWWLGARISLSVKDLFTKLPAYYDSDILPALNSASGMLTELASRISPETLEQIYAMLESAAGSIRTFLLEFSSGVLSWFAGITKKIPFFFISFIFTILASIFISMDFEKAMSFVKKQIPPKTMTLLTDARQHTGKTILGYLRAYLIIWLMTFTELSIGLTILKIENSVGLAAIIATADILPVVGTGGILLPWAVVSVFMQNYYLALGLVVLYVIILSIRNFAEPKIVGDQLGLNPIITIFAIYVGYRILGISGMIILPIITTICVGLQKSGKIKIWKD